MRRYVQMVRASRAELCHALDALGIAYAPSATNFLLARFGEKSPEIARRLRKRDILVRDWSYDPNLKGYLRFTIGSQAQTRRLMAELERLHSMIETRKGPGAWKNLAESSAGWFA